jgi:hypothetical protein
LNEASKALQQQSNLQPKRSCWRSGVDGRDKPGHDGARRDISSSARFGITQPLMPLCRRRPAMAFGFNL